MTDGLLFEWSELHGMEFNSEGSDAAQDNSQDFTVCINMNGNGTLPHKVKSQYVHFRLCTNYFLLPWKIPEELADYLGCSITKGSIYHIKHKRCISLK